MLALIVPPDIIKDPELSTPPLYNPVHVRIVPPFMIKRPMVFEFHRALMATPPPPDCALQLRISESESMMNVHPGETDTPPPFFAAQPIILPPVMVNVLFLPMAES